jgi:hypothetical protein
MSTGKKRFWSDDEKREICGQTRVEEASVALLRSKPFERRFQLLNVGKLPPS